VARSGQVLENILQIVSWSLAASGPELGYDFVAFRDEYRLAGFDEADEL